MLILRMPLFAWGGMFLLLCLILQGYLGWATGNGKPYFKFHKILGFLIILFAIGHGILAFLFLKFGIVI